MNKDLIRYAAILVVGVAIGAIFYPSKDISREVSEFYKTEISRIQEENLSRNTQLQEQLQISESKFKSSQEESNAKISTLTRENSDLKQKVTERTLQIIKPDGTMVTETFKESDTHMVTQVVTEVKEEFNRKVSRIEQDYKEIHTKRILKIKEQYDFKLKEQETTIAELKSKERIRINQRKFGVALGYTADQDYYLSSSYDIVGPIFFDSMLKANRDLGGVDFGVGLGLRF